MPKYCVYDKGPGQPVEVWEYIDDIKVASKYWYVQLAIDKYGVNDVMPICMNKSGGYHTCYMPQVKCIIEADTWPTLDTHRELFTSDINNPSFNCGWIDPQGNTYMCNYMGHTGLASELVVVFYKESYTKHRTEKDLVNDPDDFLIEKGWIRVLSSSPWHIVSYNKTTDVAMAKLDEIEKKYNRLEARL